MFILITHITHNAIPIPNLFVCMDSKHLSVTTLTRFYLTVLLTVQVACLHYIWRLCHFGSSLVNKKSFLTNHIPACLMAASHRFTSKTWAGGWKKSPNVKVPLAGSRTLSGGAKWDSNYEMHYTAGDTHTSVSFLFSLSPGCSLAVRMPKSNFLVIAMSTQQNSLTHRVKCANAKYIYTVLAYNSLINARLTQ